MAQLVKDKLGYKYHWAVADYLQRAARYIASKVDVEQAYAVGKAAVELALKGHHAGMPAIVRVSDKPYRWKIGVAKLGTSPTSRRRCRATSSRRTASTPPRTAGATSSR